LRVKITPLIKDVSTPVIVKYHEVVLGDYWKKPWRKGPGEKVSFETRVEHQIKQANNRSREWRMTGGCSGGTYNLTDGGSLIQIYRVLHEYSGKSDCMVTLRLE